MANEKVELISYEKTKISFSLVVICSITGSFMFLIFQLMQLQNKLAINNLKAETKSDIVIIKKDMEIIKLQVGTILKKQDEFSHKLEK